MARTTGTKSLSDLISGGILQDGEKLELRRRSASTIIGVLQGDGTIRVGSAVSTSPSVAARLATGAKAVDGWQRWRVPRLGGKTLEAVREGR